MASTLIELTDANIIAMKGLIEMSHALQERVDAFSESLSSLNEQIDEKMASTTNMIDEITDLSNDLKLVVQDVSDSTEASYGEFAECVPNFRESLGRFAEEFKTACDSYDDGANVATRNIEALCDRCFDKHNEIIQNLNELTRVTQTEHETLKTEVEELVIVVSTTTESADAHVELVRDGFTEWHSELTQEAEDLASGFQSLNQQSTDGLQSVQERMTDIEELVLESVTSVFVSEIVSNLEQHFGEVSNAFGTFQSLVESGEQVFGGDVGEMLSSVDGILDLIQSIKPVLDAVRRLS